MTPTLEACYIEWIDSCTTYGWHDADKEGLSRIRSVGILVKEDKEMVIISTSRSEHGRVVDQLAIPRVAIRAMRRVSLSEKRKR